MAKSESKPNLMIFFLSSSAASFFLHYSWEKFQCAPYFVHGGESIGTWPMAAAALGDLVLTWLTFMTVVVFSRSWRWFVQSWTLKQWAIMVGMALGLSIGLEFIALRSGRWHYTVENPLLPILGISALPVLQLVILFPLSFSLWRSLFKRLEYRQTHAEASRG